MSKRIVKPGPYGRERKAMTGGSHGRRNEGLGRPLVGYFTQSQNLKIEPDPKERRLAGGCQGTHRGAKKPWGGGAILKKLGKQKLAF